MKAMRICPGCHQFTEIVQDKNGKTIKTLCRKCLEEKRTLTKTKESNRLIAKEKGL